jgi:hypothetical protein
MWFLLGGLWFLGGTIRGDHRSFVCLVRSKPTPVVMVPPRHPRGWGREGFGGGRMGRGAGRTGQQGLS